MASITLDASPASPPRVPTVSAAEHRIYIVLCLRLIQSKGLACLRTGLVVANLGIEVEASSRVRAQLFGLSKGARRLW